ncbi:hypothetical protein [Stieleria varia]|uniref:hypothetical protein n=1 Tax=Stieleria varia TaxID=2528005 RepID=UPI0011B8558D|nr:hypothetical protein [Stieleria varia]
MPDQAGSSAPNAGPAIEPSAQVRDHMQRVQDWFDETNHQVVYRLAFVASISEIRARRPTDKLVGELAEGEADVAVLRVRAMGRNADVGFKKSSVIVCPIGELRLLWESRERNVEILFEYNRIGERVRVQKFGC